MLRQRVIRKVIIFITILTWCFSLGCIRPPQVTEPSILSRQELRLVSNLNRGKEYAGSGRLDLAEVELRRALRLEPRLHGPHNDLGFVLAGQSRFEEAEQSFKRALELEPLNLTARDNLARLYYQTGKYKLSLEQYEQLIDVAQSAEPKLLSRVLGKDFTTATLSQIFRSMSAVYYALGVYDEAVCHSSLAFVLNSSVPEAQLHARLLLSLGKADSAHSILKNSVIATQGQLPASMLLDYAFSLYDVGEKEIARTILNRVVNDPTISFSDRRSARLMRLALETHATNKEPSNTEEVEAIRESILDDEPEICEGIELDPEQYWPRSVETLITSTYKELCAV